MWSGALDCHANANAKQTLLPGTSLKNDARPIRVSAHDRLRGYAHRGHASASDKLYRSVSLAGSCQFWHFFAYAVLAIFAYTTDVLIRPQARNRLLPLMGFLLAFAICDEVTQSLF